ncbi:unnamed protein product [Lasius platythorax]|uniref:Transmembrane protein 223 n=1 Tax=Lasius platythorax TaxID=488582 RepID=A0AAV2N868_9HYME
MACMLSKAPILCRATFHKNITFGSVTKITRLQSYEHYSNRTNAIAEQKFRLKDNISKDYKLVYREQGIINITTTIAYNAGWIGIILSASLMGYIIYKNPPVEGVERTFGQDAKGVIKPLSKLNRALIILFGFAASLTLIIGSKAIPFRIYYSSAEKLYKALFVRSVLGKKQIVTFGEGTAVPIFKRKHLGDLLFKINGRTVLLDKECFPVPFVRERMISKTD